MTKLLNEQLESRLIVGRRDRMDGGRVAHARATPSAPQSPAASEISWLKWLPLNNRRRETDTRDDCKAVMNSEAKIDALS